jgi:transposase-like protein
LLKHAASVLPQTVVQTCIAYPITNNLAFVSWRRRSCRQSKRSTGPRPPSWHFSGSTSSGKRYPAIGAAWRRTWEYVVPFCAVAPEISRRSIYTVNAVEALHRSLRKIIKTYVSFPNDDAAPALAPVGRMDYEPVRHPVRRALSGNNTMMNDITATFMRLARTFAIKAPRLRRGASRLFGLTALCDEQQTSRPCR